jgi:hypothetical protein
MVHLNILRKVRRKPKSKENTSENDSAPSTPKNNDESSYASSEEESYLSSDMSFYSSSSGSSDYYDDDDDDDDEDECLSDDISSIPCAMPNLVRAIAQYASLDICKINHEDSSKSQGVVKDKASEKIKASDKVPEQKKISEGGFKSFQHQVGGKFETILRSLDTRSKAKEEISNVSHVKTTETDVHRDEKDNASFTEKFQKQFQEWTDRAKKFESLHLLNAYNSETGEDLHAAEVSKNIIESRNEDDEITRDDLDKRDEPVLSPRKARSLRLANRRTYSFMSRGRTRSEGHKDSFQKMAIISPRLTTNVIRPILSPKQSVLSPKQPILSPKQPIVSPKQPKNSPKQPKKNVFSPKKCKVPCIRKRRDRAISRGQNDDIDIDELVAHVIRKRSTETSYEQDENLFRHSTSIIDKESPDCRQQNSDTFSLSEEHTHQESEGTAKKLELAQKEIEYLKRLLQEKERVPDRDDKEKMTNEISFNLSEMQLSGSSGLSSNQSKRDVSDKDSSGCFMDVFNSHEEIFDQDDMFPFAEIDFEHNSKSVMDDISSGPDGNGHGDLFWDNILVNTGSGYDEHDDEVSLLSNTFSPRRYGKPKRISIRKS